MFYPYSIRIRIKTGAFKHFVFILRKFYPYSIRIRIKTTRPQKITLLPFVFYPYSIRIRIKTGSRVAQAFRQNVLSVFHQNKD